MDLTNLGIWRCQIHDWFIEHQRRNSVEPTAMKSQPCIFLLCWESLRRRIRLESSLPWFSISRALYRRQYHSRRPENRESNTFNTEAPAKEDANWRAAMFMAQGSEGERHIKEQGRWPRRRAAVENPVSSALQGGQELGGPEPSLNSFTSNIRV